MFNRFIGILDTKKTTALGCLSPSKNRRRPADHDQKMGTSVLMGLATVGLVCTGGTVGTDGLDAVSEALGAGAVGAVGALACGGGECEVPCVAFPEGTGAFGAGAVVGVRVDGVLGGCTSVGGVADVGAVGAWALTTGTVLGARVGTAGVRP